MPSTERVSTLLSRIRDRLDEELDPETNFWSESELVEYVNEGCREVWQTMREAHESWFTRTLTSDLGVVTIMGRDYDTGALQFQTGGNEIRLPPDFFEMRYLETALPADGTQWSPQFEQRPVNHPDFRNAAKLTNSASDQHYFYDIERRTDGAVLLIAGSPVLDTSLVLTLKYIQGPPYVNKLSTFEDTGFEPFMIDAVIAYVILRSREKEGDSMNIANATADWERKRTFALRAAGPRQSRDPEVVIGYLEDEIY